MKAPDKIVMPAAAREMQSLIDDTVYIRMDALLEWAKEKAEDYKGTANIRRSFEMMIRKLNSI